MQVCCRDTFAMSRVKANWRRIATWFDGFKKAGEGWKYLQSWENRAQRHLLLPPRHGQPGPHRPCHLHGVPAPHLLLGVVFSEYAVQLPQLMLYGRQCWMVSDRLRQLERINLGLTWHCNFDLLQSISAHLHQ